MTIGHVHKKRGKYLADEQAKGLEIKFIERKGDHPRAPGTQYNRDSQITR